MRRHWIVRLALIALFILIVIAGLGQAVLQLWNWLMPGIFGLPALTFWQAVGLLGLSWILFGGLRGLPGRHGHWRHRMRERWEQMTPEQREEFRKAMHGRCGHRSDSSGAAPSA